MTESSTCDGCDRWDTFRNWAVAVCVVTFDLEVGQALELLLPQNVALTEKEKMNICYLSFPDSNSGCMGDTQFHFRMRRFLPPCCSTESARFSFYNQRCPFALQADASYYYGFVYFRQEKDKTIPRGYLQKSVVLLTHLPLIKLFEHIVSIIAPEFFENGELSLESFCHNMNQWPKPEPGKLLTLPAIGSVLQCYKGAFFTLGVFKIYFQSPALTLRSAHEVNIYDCFWPVISHVQLLWELVLIGEPILIMTQSPSVCSIVVQALVSLTWPFKYCHDYRPYFTVHDSEFKEYTSKTQFPPNVILGVTNAIFAKTLDHWPHVIRLGGDSNSATGELRGCWEMLEAYDEFYHDGLPTCYQSDDISWFLKLRACSVPTQKLRKSTDLKTLDSKPGVYTQYRTFLSKDKNLIKRLFKAKRPSEAQNAMLRAYFLELTQSFMVPLERYVASLMPLKRNISPFKAAPQIRRFEIEEFLSTLQVSGPQLTSDMKGDWIGLYRMFFKSQNFKGWLHLREEEINQKLQMLHLEVLCSADLTADFEKRTEVENVDLVLKLRDKLKFVEENRASVRDELRTRISSQFDAVLVLLPEDLRTIF